MPRATKSSNRVTKASAQKSKKILNLTEKIEVILYHTKSKCSMRKLAQQFKIGKTQAGAIIRNQDKYVKLWQSGSVDIGKRAKFAPDSIGLIIDQRVKQWYEEQISEKHPVSGNVLQNKALEIARELGNEEFKASSGWLDAFKKRHKITFSKTPEKMNCSSENSDDWEVQLEAISAEYPPDDVFCAHETGLFYHAIPDDTSGLKNETCLNGEMPEKRLTALLCTNMTGQKECPLIIIKDQELKPDNDLDSASMYSLESNAMAWMTPEIMAKWLTKLDQKMIDQKRSICLFLNNTQTHRCPKLKNVKIVYFPTHLFGEIQPMNHGIIQSFKTHYRLLTLQHLIAQRDKEEEGQNSIEVINISKALSWIKAAWDVVSPALIERSFKAAGFNCICTEIGQADNEPSLNEVAELLYAFDSDVDAVEYVNIDANLVTEPEDTEHINNTDNSIDIINSNDVFKIEEIETDLDLKSYSEAVRNIKFLEEFFLSRNDSTGLSIVHKLLAHTESLLGDDDCSS